ncbi:hypothetical protein [Zafaria cholistanensis]|uniref:hypothetical protein n=1 Tax=Zafaria cholistanensis TaxID=1682741 RepID=UPI0012311F51|nr:hypothetical protein [Zafaria cholistanensis]
MEHRSQRILRGWLGALAATSLAAASHGMVGGSLPPLPVLALTLALSGAICTALSGRGLSLLRTSAGVLLSQGIFHLVFGIGAHRHAAGRLTETVSHHGTETSIVWTAATATAPLAPEGAPLLEAPLLEAPLLEAPMLAAHLAAALLTIAVLRKGGLAMRATAEALLLTTPVEILRWKPAPAVVRLARPATCQVPGLPDLGVPLLALRHRGPPACPAS